MRDTKRVTEQILRNLAKYMKIAVFGLQGPNQRPEDALRVIQWGPALYS